LREIIEHAAPCAANGGWPARLHPLGTNATEILDYIPGGFRVVRHVLAPGLGRTKTGRIWTYVRDDRPFGGTAAAGVFYRYTPDRKGEHPRGSRNDARYRSGRGCRRPSRRHPRRSLRSSCDRRGSPAARRRSRRRRRRGNAARIAGLGEQRSGPRSAARSRAPSRTVR
jgi:hypothetical protein